MERMTSPNYSDMRKVNVEMTLCLIKPDGVIYRLEIEERLIRAGFRIMNRRTIRLSPEQASEFYKDQYGCINYPLIILSLTAGPVIPLVVAKAGAVKELNALLGPESFEEACRVWPGSLRAKYADCNDKFKNAIHCSVDHDHARYEIRFFYPEIIIEPIMCCPYAQKKYLNTNLNPVLMDGIYQCTQVRPCDPVVWLADWLLTHNPNKPEMSPANEKLFQRIRELQVYGAQPVHPCVPEDVCIGSIPNVETMPVTMHMHPCICNEVCVERDEDTITASDDLCQCPEKYYYEGKYIICPKCCKTISVTDSKLVEHPEEIPPVVNEKVCICTDLTVADGTAKTCTCCRNTRLDTIYEKQDEDLTDKLDCTEALKRLEDRMKPKCHGIDRSRVRKDRDTVGIYDYNTSDESLYDQEDKSEEEGGGGY